MEQFLGVLAGVLGVVSACLAVKKSRADHLLERLRTFASNLTMIEYRYVDAVVLGPRASGKTSIIELWTSPWTQIGQLKATSEWRAYERDIHEFEEDRREVRELQVQQVFRPTLRLRVHDYPGEDSYRLEAIRRLKEAGKQAVVVLVMRVEYVASHIECMRENAVYYNRQFAEMLMTQLKSVNSTVARVVVVFNKCDLLPADWTEEKALDELQKANKDALFQIQTVFGEVDCMLTSAATNKGLIQLLGKVGTAGLDTPHEVQRFTERLRHVEEELHAVSR
jgi:GTPase SAR1 family protein